VRDVKRARDLIQRQRTPTVKAVAQLRSVYARQGRWEEAIGCYKESLATKRELGDRHGEAQTLGTSGSPCARRATRTLAKATFGKRSPSSRSSARPRPIACANYSSQASGGGVAGRRGAS
jgi:hypothetical protein